MSVLREPWGQTTLLLVRTSMELPGFLDASVPNRVVLYDPAGVSVKRNDIRQISVRLERKIEL